MKVIIHTGTGTIINMDDDVRIVNLDSLSESELAIFDDGSDLDIADLATRVGVVFAEGYQQ